MNANKKQKQIEKNSERNKELSRIPLDFGSNCIGISSELQWNLSQSLMEFEVNSNAIELYFNKNSRGITVNSLKNIKRKGLLTCGNAKRSKVLISKYG